MRSNKRVLITFKGSTNALGSVTITGYSTKDSARILGAVTRVLSEEECADAAAELLRRGYAATTVRSTPEQPDPTPDPGPLERPKPVKP